MEQQVLMSMIDYVLNQMEINSFDEDKMKNIWNYAKFLKQELTLNMFVPCVEKNGVWNLIEKPKEKDFYTALPDVNGKKAWNTNKQLFEQALNQYQTALSKVLFSGWSMSKNDSDVISIVNENLDVIYFDSEFPTYYNGKDVIELKTLNILTTLNIPLTETGVEHFNLKF